MSLLPPNNRLFASLALSALLHGAAANLLFLNQPHRDVARATQTHSGAPLQALLTAAKDAPRTAQETQIYPIPFMVRQAHHERDQLLPVRPDPSAALRTKGLVEGLNQHFPKTNIEKTVPAQSAPTRLTGTPTTHDPMLAQIIAAKAAHPIHPVYPEDAHLEEIEGQVTVALLIDAAGAVRRTEIVRAQPAGYFEESAQQALRNSRFIPAQQNGIAVDSEKQIVVTYRLEDAGW